MERIWFASERIKRDEEFVEDCKEQGIEVCYGKDFMGCDKNTLVVTDDADIFVNMNKNCLAVIESEEDMKKFPGAKYFVMEPQDNWPDYFVRIWQRLNNIPWTIAETERLILRETVEEDLEGLVEMYSDPSMTEFTEPLYETEAEREYIKQYREQVYEIQGFGIWSVIRKEDGKLIGRAGLVSRNDYDGVETGFAIGKEYRGKGYAKEAVCECLKLAQLMDFKRVRALVMPENTASCKLLEGLGFELQGIMRHHDCDYEIWEILLH